MMNFLENQILFFLSLAIVLFVPGYFFLRAFLSKKGNLSVLERFIFSVAFSIVVVDFIILTMGRFNIPINRLDLLLGIGLVSLACYLISRFVHHRESTEDQEKLFTFSKNQTILIVLILFLTVFIKTIYLQDNILPGTTDLGHHMYWAKQITETGKLPVYAKRDIVVSPDSYNIGDSQNISDFIIGEHLIFAAIALISGIDFISYFPVLTLYLIDMFTVLTIFVLALRLFSENPFAKRIAIMSLFLIGPLFAIAPPQVKYVAGGVIGNIIGNLLLPTAFYFAFRAFKEKDNIFLVLSLFISMGLFYTHHLTGFIFGLILILSFLFLAASNRKVVGKTIQENYRYILSWPVFAFFVFALVFVVFIHTPAYITNSAVKTVVGAPSKQDHTGLTFGQFRMTTGEARVAFALMGLALFFIFWDRQNKLRSALLLGWLGLVVGMTLWPDLLMVNIPSGRVANYGTYPVSIIGAFALVSLFESLKNKQGRYANDKLVFSIFALLFVFLITDGFGDNVQNLAKNGTMKIIQTFHASAYLAGRTGATDMVLADHVYLTADSWIKLFFMRDYNFPIYRANLDRYENGVDKTEMCTLWMISSPNDDKSQQCFNDLAVDYVMVNKKTDGPQFDRADGFAKIYSNEEINIFYREKNGQ